MLGVFAIIPLLVAEDETAYLPGIGSDSMGVFEGYAYSMGRIGGKR
jgi:hypothetical protein